MIHTLVKSCQLGRSRGHVMWLTLALLAVHLFRRRKLDPSGMDMPQM